MTSLAHAEASLPPAKRPEGKAALDALWAAKWAAARRQTRNTRIFAILCFIVAPVAIYIFPSPWTFSIYLGVVLLGDVARPDGLTEKEYYAIPGAREGKRQHKCIYCGSEDKEVHVHTRSTMQTTFCADCGKRLY